MSAIDKVVKIDVNLLEDFPETLALDVVFYSQDTNSAVFEFDVKEGESAVDLNSAGMTGSIAIRTADGALFTSDDVKVEENKMSFVVPNEQLKHPGKAAGEFFIYEGDKKISAITFKFKIKLSLVDFLPPADEAVKATLLTLIKEYAGFKQDSTGDELTYENAVELGLPEWFDEPSFKEIYEAFENDMMNAYKANISKGVPSSLEAFIYSKAGGAYNLSESLLGRISPVLYGSEVYSDKFNEAKQKGFDGNYVQFLYDTIFKLEERIAALENK